MGSSSDICLFCCKAFDGFEENIIVSKFVNLLKRFSGGLNDNSDDHFRNLTLSKWLGCCKLCRVIVQGFCAEFHEMKCLELRMQWKLERLMDIMKLAGRVPSRMLKVQQLLHQVNNNYTNAESKYLASLKHFHNSRTKIIERCDKRLSKLEPRIHLERISNQNGIIGQNGQNDKNFECKICYEKFPTETFESHMTKSHNLHPCTECGQTFQTLYLWKKHNLTHQDLSMSKFSCIPCARSFAQKKELDDHLSSKRHQEVLSGSYYPCPVCKKSFKNRTSLKSHRISHMDPKSWKFKCDLCGKPFYRETVLQTHIKRHHTEDTESECPQTDDSEQEKEEIILHPEPIPEIFQCQECPNKTFPTERRLDQHIRDCHTIYYCPECNQNFNTKYLRNRHALDVHYKKLKNPRLELLAKLKLLRKKRVRRRMWLVARKVTQNKRSSGLKIRNMFRSNVDQLKISVETHTENMRPEQAAVASTLSGYKMKKIKLENQIILELEEEKTGFSSEDLAFTGGTEEVRDDVQEAEVKPDLTSIIQDQIKMSIDEPLDNGMI